MDGVEDLAFDEEEAYTTLSEDLRFNNVASDVLERLMYSPFVLEFASGVVEAELFGSLSAQESIFQDEFPRLYDIAQNQVTDQKLKSEFQQLKNTAGFLPQKLKQDSHPEGSSQATPSKYITFIRQMGQMKAVYILASLIPSMRVYRHIARKLEEFVGSNHRFTTWISMYASEAFDTSIKGLENLLDRLAIGATKKRVRNIYRVYNRALQLVVDMFFGLSEPSLIPLILRYHNTTLFCGFDLFATQPDTAADGTDDTAAYNDDHVGWCSTFFDSTSALVRPFERIKETANEKQANDKYEECIKALHDASLQLSEKYQQGIQAITPILKMPYSATYLQEQLQRLSDTETETNNQLIMSKLLKGLEEKDVERFSKYFAFKSTACFHLFNKFGKRANVISSSWCGANILQQAFYSAVSKDVGLYANQLLFREGKSTGAFETHIQSADDKLQIFQAQVEKNGGFTVFVGDPINDILCLTKANLGVVVNRSSGLLSVARQFGLQSKTLYSGLLDRVRELKSKDEVASTWIPESGIIYTSSWRELCLSFFGDDKSLDGIEDGCLDVDDDEDSENDDD